MLFSRISSCYNPFALCHNSKENFLSLEVHYILFYDPETQKVVADTKWFGNNNDFKTLELLPGIEPVRKLKPNLASKTPFFVSNTEAYHVGGRTYDIYIPTTMVPGFSIEHVAQGITQDGLHDRYYDKVTATVTACKRTYRKNDFGQIVSEYPAEATEQTVVFDCNHVWKDTPLKQRYDHLAEVATKAGVKLSYYDIEKLQTVFNITEKRSKK